MLSSSFRKTPCSHLLFFLPPTPLLKVHGCVCDYVSLPPFKVTFGKTCSVENLIASQWTQSLLCWLRKAPIDTCAVFLLLLCLKSAQCWAWEDVCCWFFLSAGEKNNNPWVWILPCALETVELKRMEAAPVTVVKGCQHSTVQLKIKTIRIPWTVNTTISTHHSYLSTPAPAKEQKLSHLVLTYKAIQHCKPNPPPFFKPRSTWSIP